MGKSFEPLPTLIAENFIISNYGGSGAVDNDDGSSWFDINNNLFYMADGLKMDYGGHNSRFWNNLVIVAPYDGQNCINVGDFKKGLGDAFYNNTCISGMSKFGKSSGCGSP